MPGGRTRGCVYDGTKQAAFPNSLASRSAAVGPGLPEVPRPAGVHRGARAAPRKFPTQIIKVSQKSVNFVEKKSQNIIVQNFFVEKKSHNIIVKKIRRKKVVKKKRTFWSKKSQHKKTY